MAALVGTPKATRRALLGIAGAGLLPAWGLHAQNASLATIATIGEPGPIDPMPYTADIVTEIAQHVFETLYIFDPALRFVPLLAADMPDVSADGRQYTIRLRDVRFHDGTKMTGDDVVDSLKRWMRLSPRGKTPADYVVSVTAPDPSTVRLDLKSGYAPLLPLLGYPNGAPAIMPARLANAQGVLHEFIGTGPYRFLEQKPDAYIRLQRYAEYRSPQGPPRGYAGMREALIEELRFVPVPNPVTRVDGLLAGQYQFADLIPPDSFGRLSGRKGVHGGKVEPAIWPILIFNTKAGPMSQVGARRAAQAAVSPPDMLAAAFGAPEFWRLEGSIYPEGTEWYDPATPGYNQADPKKAAELLRASGYSGAPVRLLVTQQYEYMFKIGQVAKVNLEDAGFKVDLQVMDWATLLQKRTDPALWEGFIAAHSVVAEPSLITILNPSYPGWWDSPDKHAALDRFVTEPDQAKRVAIWKQLQALFYSEVPTIKIGSAYNLYGISDKLTGYTSQSWPYFWNTRLAG
jgi:peptide/nickel transport system substrate-binding protein